MIRTAVLGASGHGGGELIRLIDMHPALEAVYLGAHSKAGSSLGAVHPHLAGGERRLETNDPAALPDVDVAFFALPHGASAEPAMEMRASGAKVVDLGSDFRLDSPERYEAAYGAPHPHPEQLGEWVYGLPELFAEQLIGADRIAVPGCYPTSALLGISPLHRAGLVTGPVIVDSLSGVSGAGRAAKEHLMYGAVDEGAAAYAVLTHRHQPEIEQVLGQVGPFEPTVIFTPHLIPMQRGILTTCYVPLADSADEAVVAELFADAYSSKPFVEIAAVSPNTRWVTNSNRVLIQPHFDERSRTAVVLVAIDNLTKGTAGAAIQSANISLGLDETLGLPMAGWMP
ncbi:MAG: N-acetyl-gamma-glutamyl-phosphate reductase [Acidimicrobiia bacterium]|nr:N-acetyl-gamma-glutamyl-phosphate reductase [Acidimicrobiia bacterium]